MIVDYALTNTEQKLADLLWSVAPLPSMELIRLAEKEFGWKKSTTFTILKALITKGFAKNESASVKMVLSRQQYLSGRSRRYVEDAFGGSLPGFIASFIGGEKLTPTQAEELRRLIDAHEGSGCGE